LEKVFKLLLKNFAKVNDLLFQKTFYSNLEILFIFLIMNIFAKK